MNEPLGNKEKALVAVSVLLDGHEASKYLASDKELGAVLAEEAEKLAALDPKIRMPIVASLLRDDVGG
jgi:hypothetical protein